jgi:hypothetical protein
LKVKGRGGAIVALPGPIVKTRLVVGWGGGLKKRRQINRKRCTRNRSARCIRGFARTNCEKEIGGLQLARALEAKAAVVAAHVRCEQRRHHEVGHDDLLDERGRGRVIGHHHHRRYCYFLLFMIVRRSSTGKNVVILCSRSVLRTH